MKKINRKEATVTDRNKLQAKMALHGLKAYELADAIGISRQSMSYKLNGKRVFTVQEIDSISKVLELTIEERDEIFFAS